MSVLGKRDLAPSDRVVSLLVVPFKIVTAVMMPTANEGGDVEEEGGCEYETIQSPRRILILIDDVDYIMIKTFLFPPNVQDSGEKLGRENHRGWPGHTAPEKVFLRIVMKKDCLCFNHNDYDDGDNDDKVMKLTRMMMMMITS